MNLKFRTFNNWGMNYYDLASYTSIDMTGIEWDEDIIMRSTGMTDKNGKEIWEGDIVKDMHRLYQVKFGIAKIEDNEGRRDNTVCGFYLELIAESKHLIHMDNMGLKEVIGNIYENKDLLNN